MAIDTENKRRSVSGYGGAKVAPAPDGTIGDADRYQMGWIYAGATPGGGGPVSDPEGGLIGGKLLKGGILIRGRLVG